MVYTDFADELFARGVAKNNVPSAIRLASKSKGGLTVTRVEVLRDGLAKPKGRYITLETPSLSILDERDAAVIDTAADQLRSLLPASGKILVVGVGNRRVTADALGPRTVQKILVTAGAVGELPPSLPNLREVYAVAPGVSGATGIPLAKLIQSLVAAVSPVAVLCVDSFISKEGARLGRTIQFSNTGLMPASAGSEKHLTAQNIGVPVIAAGIPTLMELEQSASGQAGSVQNNLVAVPRALDQVVGHGAALLSAAINRALQPQFTLAQLCWLSS